MYYKLHLGKDGARRASTRERTRNTLGSEKADRFLV